MATEMARSARSNDAREYPCDAETLLRKTLEKKEWFTNPGTPESGELRGPLPAHPEARHLGPGAGCPASVVTTATGKGGIASTRRH